MQHKSGKPIVYRITYRYLYIVQGISCTNVHNILMLVIIHSACLTLVVEKHRLLISYLVAKCRMSYCTLWCIDTHTEGLRSLVINNNHINTIKRWDRRTDRQAPDHCTMHNTTDAASLSTIACNTLCQYQQNPEKTYHCVVLAIKCKHFC